MSARQQIIRALSEDSLGGIATLHDVTDAEQLVDAHRAEVLTEDGQAYDGELAMLRTLARTLRIAARQADMPAIQQALLNHAIDDADARDRGKTTLNINATRQAELLLAIRTAGGRWKSGRAISVLRELGHHPISPSTASHDLATLAAAGHLVRHEEPGVRWYVLAEREGGE